MVSCSLSLDIRTTGVETRDGLPPLVKLIHALQRITCSFGMHPQAMKWLTQLDTQFRLRNSATVSCALASNRVSSLPQPTKRMPRPTQAFANVALRI